MNFLRTPSSPGYRAAAWGVAIVGVIAWTYYEQQRSTAGKFDPAEMEKWNQKIKNSKGGKDSSTRAAKYVWVSSKLLNQS